MITIPPREHMYHNTNIPEKEIFEFINKFDSDVYNKSPQLAFF